MCSLLYFKVVIFDTIRQRGPYIAFIKYGHMMMHLFTQVVQQQLIETDMFFRSP